MSEGTLYDEVWDRHKVTELPTGQDQLFVGLHLIHEVTSPQAFGMLREREMAVARPDLTHATVDHIVPTADQSRPYTDDAAEEMMAELEENVRDAGIDFSDPTTGNQGIVHVIGPEQGITQPGKTIVCGDSHTSTHGAFGALAFGIGTSQIRDVLATQTIAMEKQKVRKIEVTGELPDDVVTIDGSELEPVVTWGTTPGQGVGVTQPIPAPEDLPADKQDTARRAQEHMRVEPGDTMEGYEVDVAFLGSCTNARLPDLRRAARVVEGREVHPDVRAMVVPGSQRVQAAAEEEGLKDVFESAGFDWRNAGCSMCLGMNEDQLEGDEACASSSNRNFVGRQGSKDGRTVLMNPRMVAAAAIDGEVTDVRTVEEREVVTND